MLVAPDRVSRLAGIEPSRPARLLTLGVGARELLHGAGLLAPTPGPRWVWTRVAGDAMDIAVLVEALRRRRPGRERTVAATLAIAGITAIDLYAAWREHVEHRKEKQVELTATTTVGKQPQEVYAYWRQLERLPEFMAHVEDVTALDADRSHWQVSAPFGQSVEWDAEIVDDVPGERLSWRSVEGADVRNEGSVRFVPAPRDQGTEIYVTLSYDVPGGKLAEALARWAGEDPHQQLDDDLRRFKQVMETGEVVRSEGAPWGKRARKEFPQRPAQPLTDDEAIDLTREEVHA
jgi:uncharacterized membrane protein